MDEAHDDVRKKCRTCLVDCDNDNFSWIFEEVIESESEMSIQINEMIRFLTNIVIIDTDQNLPQVICPVCVEKLWSAYSFKLQIERIDNIINSIEDNNMEFDDDEDEEETEETEASYMASKNDLELSCILNKDEVKPMDALDREVDKILNMVDSEMEKESSIGMDLVDKRVLDSLAKKMSSENLIVPMNAYKKNEIGSPLLNYTEEVIVYDMSYGEQETTETGISDNSSAEVNNHVPEVVVSPEEVVICEENDPFNGIETIPPEDKKTVLNLPTEVPTEESLMSHRNLIVLLPKMKLKHSLTEILEPTTGEIDITCDICTDSPNFADRMKYLKHLYIVHHVRSDYNIYQPFVCKICQQSCETQAHLDAHKCGLIKPLQYDCDVCQGVFKSKASLMYHKKTHNRKKFYTCKQCCVHLATSQQFKEHALLHENEAPFQCPECLKTFKSNDNLISHRRTHSNLRPHVCKICDKSFIKPSELRIHERSHTGERPFKCKTCDRSFVRLSGLKLHEAVHSETGKFACPICHLTFKHYNTFVTHKTKKHSARNKKLN